MLRKLLVGLFVFFALVPGVFAQEEVPTPTVRYIKAKVVEILEAKDQEFEGQKFPLQTVKLQILNGPEKGKEVVIEHGAAFAIREYQKVKRGETVVVTQILADVEHQYQIIDKYRLSSLAVVFLIFFGLAVYFGRKKGAFSVAGLAVSIFVIGAFIIPQLIKGSNPLLIGLVGAVVIATLTLFLAHGFNKRTKIAYISTLLTLVIATLLALAFVYLSKLFGAGSEESFYLQLGNFSQLNLRGLLLGGILIGVLGILDDVTTAQAAAIEEIHHTNTSLSFKELYQKGLSVGREHIASLVNTLVLAYTGASLPLFLLFAVDTTRPLWVTVNSEFVAEELVRTLVGSSALILAVPITTLLAVRAYKKAD